MPQKYEKPLPPELLEQLPKALSQSFLCDEELERLAQECQAEEEEEEPIDDDHLYSKRYLYLREHVWVRWEQYVGPFTCAAQAVAWNYSDWSERYCAMSGYDQVASWIDYAQDPDAARTQKPFRSFLK